jgi:hypothetical protein
VPEDVACTITIGMRSVKVSYPGELWHVDLTAVPTGARSSGAVPGGGTAGIAPFALGSVLLASMGALPSQSGSSLR